MTVVHCIIYYTAGSVLTFTEVNTYLFFYGTKPSDRDAQRCRKIVIMDLTDGGKLCGYNSHTSVLILNNGCTKVAIGDNNGIDDRLVAYHSRSDSLDLP